MNAAGAQANRFYDQVAETKVVWFAEDSAGDALEFDTKDGGVTFPLWSSKSRIVRLKKLNPELLSEFSPREISWLTFKEDLVPTLREKDRLIGVNFSGKNLSGFDLPIDMVIGQVDGVAASAT